MKIHLAGHLNWYDHHNRTWVEVQVQDKMRLLALLQTLGIPAGEVAAALLNGDQVEIETAWLIDEDMLELFPPVSGG